MASPIGAVTDTAKDAAEKLGAAMHRETLEERLDETHRAWKGSHKGAKKLRRRMEKELEKLPSGPESRWGHSMFGLVFNRFTFGLAAGYVLGSRAGRERYDQIKRRWDGLVGNPTVQRAVQFGGELAGQAAQKTGDAIGIHGGSGQSRQIRDVMNTGVRTIDPSETLRKAAARMRDEDIGAIVVVDDRDTVCGIVTDRDIAIRGVAEGTPDSAMVADVISDDVVTLDPSATVDDAVRLMRERAVRRVPVVEGGRAVGIVSIGDLVRDRDPRSALADITSAPAST
jgi:CBS domain-containing protein